MRFYLYTGGRPSLGALGLSKNLGIKRIKAPHLSKFKPSKNKTIINWGNSSMPVNWLNNVAAVINRPLEVSVTSNKLEFFSRVSETEGVNLPDWTTDPEEAYEWAQQGVLVCRQLLTSSGGKGIILVEEGGGVPVTPLYTKYLKKKEEYRVHLFKGQAPFVQRKAKRHSAESPNWKVRNLAGGFVYVNSADAVGDVPDDVLEQARLAFDATGLDFGAVDVIWNQHHEKATVLELNTAPGLVGQTLNYYADNLNKYIKERN